MNYFLAPPTQHFTATRGRIWSALRPPLDANVRLEINVLSVVTLSGEQFQYRKSPPNPPIVPLKKLITRSDSNSPKQLFHLNVIYINVTRHITDKKYISNSITPAV